MADNNSALPANESSLPASSSTERCNEPPLQRANTLTASLPKSDEFVQNVQNLFDVCNQRREQSPSQIYLDDVIGQTCSESNLANARAIYDRAPPPVPIEVYLKSAHTASIPAQPQQQQRQMQQSHVPEGFLADTPWPMPRANKPALVSLDTLLGTNGACLSPIAAKTSKIIVQKAPITLSEALAAEIQSRQAARVANNGRRQAEDVAPRAAAKPAKKETVVAEEIPPTFESARWRLHPPTLELCRFQGRLYTNMQAAAKHAAAAPDSTRLFLAMLHLGIAVSKHESVFSNPFEQRAMFLVGDAIFDRIERGSPLKFTANEDDLFVAYVNDVLKRAE